MWQLGAGPRHKVEEIRYVAGNSESIIAQKDAEIAKLRKELDGHNHKYA